MLTKPSLKASAASDLVGKWLIWCVHPDKFKKNAKNKILTCTRFSLTSPKHLAQSVTRVFGRSLQRLDAYPKVIKIIHSFHEGMKVQVQDNEKTSETFQVTKRTKQGCVMAPLLFCVAFSAMLYETFKNCESGIMIWFRMDGGVFSICHLKSSTRVMLIAHKSAPLHGWLLKSTCRAFWTTLPEQPITLAIPSISWKPM